MTGLWLPGKGVGENKQMFPNLVLGGLKKRYLDNLTV